MRLSTVGGSHQQKYGVQVQLGHLVLCKISDFYGIRMVIKLGIDKSRFILHLVIFKVDSYAKITVRRLITWLIPFLSHRKTELWEPEFWHRPDLVIVGV